MDRLIRASRWARKIAGAAADQDGLRHHRRRTFLLVALEKLGLWPDWATLDRGRGP